MKIYFFKPGIDLDKLFQRNLLSINFQVTIYGEIDESVATWLSMIIGFAYYVLKTLLYS